MLTHADLVRRYGWSYSGYGSDPYTHDKRKRRAGITKNHSRGQSKARRRMTSASRRRNRR